MISESTMKAERAMGQESTIPPERGRAEAERTRNAIGVLASLHA
jgi:hypothetical protein